MNSIKCGETQRTGNQTAQIENSKTCLFENCRLVWIIKHGYLHDQPLTVGTDVLARLEGGGLLAGGDRDGRSDMTQTWDRGRHHHPPTDRLRLYYTNTTYSALALSREGGRAGGWGEHNTWRDVSVNFL